MAEILTKESQAKQSFREIMEDVVEVLKKSFEGKIKVCLLKLLNRVKQ